MSTGMPFIQLLFAIDCSSFAIAVSSALCRLNVDTDMHLPLLDAHRRKLGLVIVEVALRADPFVLPVQLSSWL
jgi:hypothetical protein